MCLATFAHAGWCCTAQAFLLKLTVCEVQSCLYFFGSVCGERGRKHPVFKPNRFPFSASSQLVSLPLCHRGYRVALGVPVSCRRRGPTSCPGARTLSAAPGAEAAPPGVEETRVLPCLVLPVCPWAGSARVCIGVCVSLCLCRGKVVGRK